MLLNLIKNSNNCIIFLVVNTCMFFLIDYDMCESET